MATNDIQEFRSDFTLAFKQFSRVAMASGVDLQDLELFAAKLEVCFRFLASIIEEKITIERRRAIERSTTPGRN